MSEIAGQLERLGFSQAKNLTESSDESVNCIRWLIRELESQREANAKSRANMADAERELGVQEPLRRQAELRVYEARDSLRESEARNRRLEQELALKESTIKALRQRLRTTKDEAETKQRRFVTALRRADAQIETLSVNVQRRAGLPVPLPPPPPFSTVIFQNPHESDFSQAILKAKDSVGKMISTDLAHMQQEIIRIGRLLGPEYLPVDIEDDPLSCIECGIEAIHHDMQGMREYHEGRIASLEAEIDALVIRADSAEVRFTHLLNTVHRFRDYVLARDPSLARILRS